MPKIALNNLNLDQKNAFKLLPQTFFMLSKSGDHVTLRLPAKFVTHVLEPKIIDWLPDYLRNENDWMNKTKGSVLGSQI